MRVTYLREGQEHFKAGGEDIRGEGRVDDRPLRRAMPNQGIPISAEGHESGDTWLDTLRERDHDAPVVRGTDPAHASMLAAFFHRKAASSAPAFIPLSLKPSFFAVPASYFPFLPFLSRAPRLALTTIGHQMYQSDT